MIEKILERLRNESHVDRSKVYSPQQCDAIEFTFRRAYDIVQEVAKEYGNNIILDYLQFVRDNADKYDSEDGWALSDLIILATEYQKGE